MDADCPFCRIVRGELPAAELERTESCIAILDRNQAARGHVLIIPLVHVAMWHALDEVTAVDMARLAHRWANALVVLANPAGYNVLINNGAAAGQDVFHAHLHVTPRSDGDGYYAFGGRVEALSESELDALATALRRAAR